MTVLPGTRKLVAILSADVCGYSRLMGSNEEDTLQRLNSCRDIVFGLIEEHNGRVANTAGDAVLAEFASVVDAVRGAIRIQESLSALNATVPAERQMLFRIGINLGDVIEQGGDIFGDGVNVAARIQSLADPGGVFVSGSVQEQIQRRPAFQTELVGEQKVKNIERPIRVYRVLAGTPRGPSAATASAERSPAGTGFKALTIAVLPFDNLSDDPGQSYFGDGLTEDLITGLATITELSVTARNTMFTYKGRAVDVRKLQNELGASHVVEGSYRKSGNRLRINVQLIDIASGNHLWAKRYDKELAEFFEIQDDIVDNVVTELDIQLVHGEMAREWRRYTRNAEAYDLFRQASSANYENASFAPEDISRSIALLDRALRLDPGFVTAYVWKARTILARVAAGISADLEADIKQSRENLERALQIDETAADAHSCMGVLLSFTGEFDAAEKEFERALALDPNLPDTHAGFAVLKLNMEDYAAALLATRRALELSRTYESALYSVYEMFALIGLGRLEEAWTITKKGLDRHPDTGSLLMGLVALAEALNLPREMEAARAKLLEVSPEIRTSGTTPAWLCGKKVREWFVTHMTAAGLL